MENICKQHRLVKNNNICKICELERVAKLYIQNSEYHNFGNPTEPLVTKNGIPTKATFFFQ